MFRSPVMLGPGAASENQLPIRRDLLLSCHDVVENPSSLRRTTDRPFGGTALIPAAERGHVDVVAELLTHSDVDVNHVNNLGWTALLEAIVLSDGGPRHQQIVQLLIAHGATVNLPDKDGVTPLQHARQRGFAVIERLLLQAGAR